MCCFFAALFFLGPRMAFLVYWLLPFGQLKVNAAFNTWVWPLLGLIFLPWTTLMYVIVVGPGGLVGFDWLWMGLAVLADIAAYGASAARRRDASFYRGP
jgi:hypothetical protein